jgi:hypothetical protein
MGRAPSLRHLTILALAALAAAPCRAEHVVELVPAIGVRNGVTLSPDASGVGKVEAGMSGTIGFGVNVQVKPDGWFESFVDHQSLTFDGAGTDPFDVAVDYLQFGGRYQPGEGSIHPFVSAALGFTRFGSHPGDVGNSVGVSGSLAGGFQVPIGRSAAFHFEARGYATLDNAAISAVCGPGCFITFHGDGWYQFAARAGFAFRM